MLTGPLRKQKVAAARHYLKPACHKQQSSAENQITSGCSSGSVFTDTVILKKKTQQPTTALFLI